MRTRSATGMSDMLAAYVVGGELFQGSKGMGCEATLQATEEESQREETGFTLAQDHALVPAWVWRVILARSPHPMMPMQGVR